jgi:hypothetical protein
MYVRGYLQGSEYVRVVTIDDSSHWNYFRKSSMKEVTRYDEGTESAEVATIGDIMCLAHKIFNSDFVKISLLMF